MERRTAVKYSWVDFAFSVIGVCAFLVDWGSDLWVAAELYCRGDLLWFGVLVGLMVLSSVVVQTFSWFWFTYDRQLPAFSGESGGETVLCAGRAELFCLLHVLQLGFLCRHVWAIRQGFRVWWRQSGGSEYAVYLSHDLSMLRLIETFSESAPQLVLMASFMLRSHRGRPVQLVSAAASTTSMAWMLVDYHRSLRSFLPDKAQQGWLSSLVYFLWNLLLIGPRVAALALFSSVLPGLVAAHFLLLWPALALWAGLQRTHFMDSPGGERLYRATVGLIWYFSWFNVAEGRTRGRGAIYHAFLTVDGALLLATWWFHRDPLQTEAYAAPLLAGLPLAHLLGLLLKAVYYCCFHPRLWRPPAREAAPDDLPDAQVPSRGVASQDAGGGARLLNRRMAGHAAFFYSERSAARSSEDPSRTGSTCL